MYIIYKIQNTINKKFYIGFTTENPPIKRFWAHKERSKKKVNIHLYNAMCKEGHDKFIFEILCWGEDHKAGLEIAEPLMINIFKPEYNMTQGGEGCLGRKATPEQNEANRQRNLGRKMSLDSNRKKSIKQKGGSHSFEHRQKLAEINKNRSGNYIVTPPNGDPLTIHNLSEFCYKNKLHTGAMCLVSQGIRRHHKNWKCRKAGILCS